MSLVLPLVAWCAGFGRQGHPHRLTAHTAGLQVRELKRKQQREHETLLIRRQKQQDKEQESRAAAARNKEAAEAELKQVGGRRSCLLAHVIRCVQRTVCACASHARDEEGCCCAAMLVAAKIMVVPSCTDCRSIAGGGPGSPDRGPGGQLEQAARDHRRREPRRCDRLLGW